MRCGFGPSAAAAADRNAQAHVTSSNKSLKALQNWSVYEVDDDATELDCTSKLFGSFGFRDC